MRRWARAQARLRRGRALHPLGLWTWRICRRPWTTRPRYAPGCPPPTWTTLRVAHSYLDNWHEGRGRRSAEEPVAHMPTATTTICFYCIFRARFAGNSARFAGNSARFAGNSARFAGNSARFAGNADNLNSGTFCLDDGVHFTNCPCLPSVSVLILNRLDAAAHSHVAPSVEELPRPGGRDVGPEVVEVLLEDVCACGFHMSLHTTRSASDRVLPSQVKKPLNAFTVRVSVIQSSRRQPASIW